MERLQDEAIAREEDPEEALRFLEEDVEWEQGESVQLYMQGLAPFSDAQVDAGFERYMAHAHATQRLFNSGEMQRAWTLMLQQLPNVGRFRMVFWDFDGSAALSEREETSGLGWEALGCNVHEHGHDDSPSHPSSVHGDGTKCLRLQEPVGEALFHAALASLIAAGSSVSQLDVKSAFDGSFAWADDAQPNALNLSDMHTLFFRPRAESSRPEGEGRLEYTNDRSELALTQLLKSAARLKVLELSHPCADAWPLGKSDIVALPALERFTANTMALALPNFARFIRSATSLKRLELRNCDGCEGTWRDVWRAIRCHPSRMHLDSQSVYLLPHDDGITLKHRTADASKSTPDAKRDWIDVVYRLEGYASGRAGWSVSCRDRCQDETGWDTDEEDAAFWRGEVEARIDEDGGGRRRRQ